MGVYQLYAACAVCRRMFTSHPHRVPSVRVRGEREPICRACVERANPQRIAKGLPPIVILQGAYEPAAESDADDVLMGHDPGLE